VISYKILKDNQIVIKMDKIIRQSICSIIS